jgi:hypothetical protein
VKSNAKSVEEYLNSLPEDREEAISQVREIILNNLPKGFEETMQYGMISYVIPLEDYPDTYNGKPLTMISLASQKNYMSLYLNNIYADDEAKGWFKKKYQKTDKKMDMGKSCVRFKSVDNLPLNLIAEAVARTSKEEFIKLNKEIRK